MNLKPKMSGRRLRRILLPVIALTTALACTVTAGMLGNAATLNDLYGRGEQVVEPIEGVSADYYTQQFSTKAKARKAAAALSKRISDEGIVLLKNNRLLPLGKSTRVSPFGLRYALPYYSGSGSSAVDSSEDYFVTPSEGLHNAFYRVNTALERRLEQIGQQPLDQQPEVVSCAPLEGATEENTLYELSASFYEGLEDSCKDTVAVVYLGRQTGENQDASTASYEDGTAHMLALTQAERDTIAYAKAHCDGVVVVLASSSPMQIAELEDDPDIQAILWMGGAGCSGYDSLADILAGDVVPSGRTPDLYPADFTKDPTFPNQDDGSDRFVYDNAYTTLTTNYVWEEGANTPFREYEEGIYLGYRYYETAWDTGYLTDYYSRENGVLYPFGYGLSYTTFSQEIAACRETDEEISLTIRVTNTGREYAGKEVVQVYFTPPYTALDEAAGIEKSTVSLIRFAKTGLLAPGESEEITLSFAKEDMASYCCTRENPDGTTGCYLLEAGDYIISLRADSHTVLEQYTVQISDTIWYDSTHPRQSERDAQSELAGDGALLPSGDTQAATNQFGQLTAYMTNSSISGATVLSRSDWSGTWPTAPTAQDRIASDTVVQWIQASDSTKFQSDSDPLLGDQPGSLVYTEAMPESGASNHLTLANLRGRSYSDPAWEDLLDQLTYTEESGLSGCLLQAAYHVSALPQLGKPESSEHDGAQGLTLADLSGKNWLTGTCAYPSSPVMAATWNQELLYELGYMVGQEALLSGINGWYATGLNLHRSPFSGRVSEYFSEDPVLSGYLGSQLLSGGGDAGIYCAVKHFALMDSECHKSCHTATWLTEQTLRELYLKPFELALKTARKTIRCLSEDHASMEQRILRAGDFVMTAECAVGADWTATSYELLTCVLRGEWGFQGAVISDMQQKGNGAQASKMLRAGCDLLMSTSGGAERTLQDTSSATGRACIRRAVHHLCYTQVNSSLMQGVAPGAAIHYRRPLWQAGLIAADATAGVVVISLCIWILWRARDERRHPERYGDMLS